MKDLEPIIFHIGNATYDLIAFGVWFLIVVSASTALRLLFTSWDRSLGTATRVVTSGAATALLTGSTILSLLANWG
jgi:hypothetical protein